MAPYDDVYRRKHQLVTSIFRRLGYGQRIMENRIIVEVAELISQARLINGQLFDPTGLLNTCVLNVSVSMQLGRRQPYNHPKLVKLQQLIHNAFSSGSIVMEIFRLLRFVPPFRGQYRRHVSNVNSLKKACEDEVRHTIVPDWFGFVL
jgi:hypothetical protein